MGRKVGERQKNSTSEPDLLAGKLAGNRKIGTQTITGSPFAAPFFVGEEFEKVTQKTPEREKNRARKEYADLKERGLQDGKQ